MARFGRVITAMITPFKEDFSLDLEGAASLARFLVDHGSEGIVVSGTTGESATLSFEEKVSLFRRVKQAVGGRAAVIAGTGTNSTSSTIQLTQAAEEAGCDAALVVTPYYNRPPQRGLVEHFTRVAQATRLPIIPYNIPSRTATAIEPETLARLAQVPGVVALKESGGDFTAASRMMALVPEGFEFYSGQDEWTLPLLALGAVGVISVASHVVGEGILSMVSAFEKGDVGEARRLHYRLLPAFRAMFVTTNPIPVKAACEMLGLPAGPPRPPLVPASPEEREKVKEGLRAAGVGV